MDEKEIMKDYRDVDITTLLTMIEDFRRAITKAPTVYFLTLSPFEEPRQIANESIMTLWENLCDNILPLVVYEWAKGVFFRTDDTLHYIFNDGNTAYVWVCEYCGLWDGQDAFNILDIDKSGGD